MYSPSLLLGAGVLGDGFAGSAANATHPPTPPVINLQPTYCKLHVLSAVPTCMPRVSSKRSPEAGRNKNYCFVLFRFVAVDGPPGGFLISHREYRAPCRRGRPPGWSSTVGKRFAFLGFPRKPRSPAVPRPQRAQTPAARAVRTMYRARDVNAGWRLGGAGR